ncbi:hypothetical protein [Xanthobacter versatilis]|uniref:hypothetical protein n=1 Tax=Xanthobacter autotrophicus (strain ATCC BAA-1158 / Py2) TaxID=78245 RepID=UPI003729C1A1
MSSVVRATRRKAGSAGTGSRPSDIWERSPGRAGFLQMARHLALQLSGLGRRRLVAKALDEMVMRAITL